MNACVRAQAYDDDYGDHALAARRFDAAVPDSQIDLFTNSTDGLVHGAPKPIIDWPRSAAIDVNGKTAGICGGTKACAAMNAHFAAAFRDLAILERVK